MADQQTTPPRAPVFQCAECGAIWRTERQRDRCCTAKPETVQQPTEKAEGAKILEAVDAFVRAYQQRYARPATGGVRNDAPLRSEVGELMIVAQAARKAFA